MSKKTDEELTALERVHAACTKAGLEPLAEPEEAPPPVRAWLHVLAARGHAIARSGATEEREEGWYVWIVTQDSSTLICRIGPYASFEVALIAAAADYARVAFDRDDWKKGS